MSNHSNSELIPEILTLIGQLISIKTSIALFEGWKALRSHGMSQNVDYIRSSKANSYEKSETSQTMSVVASSLSERLKCNLAKDIKCLSFSWMKYKQRQKTESEDKIAEKIQFIEKIVRNLNQRLEHRNNQAQKSQWRLGQKETSRSMNNYPNRQGNDGYYNQYLFNFPKKDQPDRFNCRKLPDFQPRNMTDILGFMFDDETESIKDMIQAIKVRTPDKLLGIRRQFVDYEKTPKSSRLQDLINSHTNKVTADNFHEEDLLSSPRSRIQDYSWSDIPSYQKWAFKVHPLKISLQETNGLAKCHSRKLNENKINFQLHQTPSFYNSVHNVKSFVCKDQSSTFTERGSLKLYNGKQTRALTHRF